MTELHRATLISLKDSTELSERWLQGVLKADPSLLGLGDLTVRDVERRQPGAGRLDLLLADPESAARYEVEIQLGATDETHIIRTIEYWDLERRRYPQYEHVAVLVAEDVTSRFLNVINLFNGFIPIVAIQLQALKVEGALTLVATRVVDQMSLATEEEDEDTSVDRGYWEKGRGSTTSLQILDALMELIRTVEPDLQPNFTKSNGRAGEQPRASQLRNISPPQAARHCRVPHSSHGGDRRRARKRWNRHHGVQPSAPDATECASPSKTLRLTASR